MPGQQLVEPGSGMIGDAAQHVGEPSLWIDAVEFCRGDQAIYGNSTLSAAVGAGE
jgi:hypothetical protein